MVAGGDRPARTGGAAPGRWGFSGCVRLPLRVEAARIAAELDGLPESVWTTRDRDPFVHADVASLHLLGERRGATVVHTDELPALASLPALRHVVRTLLPGRPRRVVVARLRAGGLIPLHCDAPSFHQGSVRLSLCIASDARVRTHCAGRCYAMRPGEVWALDNLAPHGVVHRGRVPRIHAVADVEPDAALLELLPRSERGLGRRAPGAWLGLRARTQLRVARMRLSGAARRLRGGGGNEPDEERAGRA